MKPVVPVVGVGVVAVVILAVYDPPPFGISHTKGALKQKSCCCLSKLNYIIEKSDYFKSQLLSSILNPTKDGKILR